MIKFITKATGSELATELNKTTITLLAIVSETKAFVDEDINPASIGAIVSEGGKITEYKDGVKITEYKGGVKI